MDGEVLRGLVQKQGVSNCLSVVKSNVSGAIIARWGERGERERKRKKKGRRESQDVSGEAVRVAYEVHERLVVVLRGE